MSIHSADCHSPVTEDDVYCETVHIQNQHDKADQPKTTYTINDADMVYIENSLKMCKKIYKRIKPVFQENHANHTNSCCRIN